MILSILLIFFCIRLVSLKISINHSKQLKADGAVEYGVKNSKFLAITRFNLCIGWCRGIY